MNSSKGQYFIGNPSLGELRQTVQKVYRQGGGSRPDVLLVQHGQGKAVLKDHGACDPWFAKVLGPVLTWREARALNRLHGVSGVPDILGRPSSSSLLLEYLSATQLSDDNNENIDWSNFFRRLEILLDDIHKRGVAHCDLRSPFNTLIDAEGNPVIVDFVASVSRGRSWNLVANWVFERFARADKEAMTKLKKSVASELISEQEQTQYLKRSRLEQLMRWIGVQIRSLSRKIFTQSDN